MDTGPILRDIMLGQCSDDFLSDAAFVDFPTSPETSCEQEVLTLTAGEDSRPTRSSGGKSKPNGALLGSKCRKRTKRQSSSTCSSEELRSENERIFSAEDLSEIFEGELQFNSRGGCMTKNAIAARENRIRKKMYINKLEKNVRSLTTENAELRRSVGQLSASVEDLTEEVRYLKGILSNVDEISDLIRGVRSTKSGESMGTSLRPGDTNDVHKRKREDQDHDYDSPDAKRKRSVVSDADGVCLHVASGAVSLEFCHRCSTRSREASTRRPTTADCVELLSDGGRSEVCRRA